MQRETFEDLCAGYVLGALTTEEALEFERALAAADDDSRRFFQGMAYVAMQLPLSVELVQPPSHIKVKILQAILPQPEPEPSLFQKIISALQLNRPAVAWAFSFLFLIGISGVSVFSFLQFDAIQQYQRDIRSLKQKIQDNSTDLVRANTNAQELKNQLKRARRELHQARLTIAQQGDLIRILKERTAQLVSLHGLGKFKHGYGKVIWDIRTQKAVLQIANLPLTDSERDYQLWLIPRKRKGPVSAGVFAIEHAAAGHFFTIPKHFIPASTKHKKNYKLFAITIEKKGGSPAPTSAPILAGKIHL